MENNWCKYYSEGVPHKIDTNKIVPIPELLKKSSAKFGSKIAFSCLGAHLTFNEFQKKSEDFAAFLQNSLGVKKGDRVAVQLPNILPYPIVLNAILMTGALAVNTNPLYTEREMEHQFKDAGVTKLIILENFAHKAQKILSNTDIEKVVIVKLGDMLGFPKGGITNLVVKKVKKMVPDYSIKNSIGFMKALKLGSIANFKAVQIDPSEVAVLQYTGGTTGVSKGAELTHVNIVSNMFQIQEWMKPSIEEGKESILTPLPLYHIFSFTVNYLAFFTYGGRNVLIPNPRDIKGFIKLFKTEKYSIMTGVNTLFNALMNAPDFETVDFSQLKLSVAGGMALQKAVSEEWSQKTGSMIVEGYGLTESSPVASCSPLSEHNAPGTIGVPLPSTKMKVIKEDGSEAKVGEVGEIYISGPQVMKGYWNRADETAKVLTEDGWLMTGDMGCFNEKGFFKIVDRKKDMILVSGFNVYPNEIEDEIVKHPKILEVAAIGVPDEKSGEAVKVFVVRKDDSLTAQEVKDFARKSLTGYKSPDHVEFRAELPKSNVGKILRKELRQPS